MMQCWMMQDLDENLAWLTQMTEESKCNTANFTFFPHTQYMQLNCKVIRKWQLPSPISISTPLFQGYLPFLAKFLVPPEYQTSYPIPPPPPTFNKRGGGGGPTMLRDIIKLFTSLAY